MKFKGTKISKRTLALFVAAVVMLGGSGVMGTRAMPSLQSDTFDRGIELDSLAVQILDNSGAEVGSKEATDGSLYSELDEKIVPGDNYESKVSIKNTGKADEYVRVVVRKYWTDDEGKNTEVDPQLIELALAEPTGLKWTKVEESDETSIYYLNKPIAKDGIVDLFTGIRINEQVVTRGRIVYDDPETEGTTTTVNYRYEFDGLKFNVEAEAQSVQTHSADKAIRSVWGVDPSSVGIDL